MYKVCRCKNTDNTLLCLSCINRPVLKPISDSLSERSPVLSANKYLPIFSIFGVSWTPSVLGAK